MSMMKYKHELGKHFEHLQILYSLSKYYSVNPYSRSCILTAVSSRASDTATKNFFLIPISLVFYKVEKLTKWNPELEN